MASIAGGMEIEKVAEEEPHLVLKQPFNLLLAFAIIIFVKYLISLGLNSEFKSLQKILRAMDAIRLNVTRLSEINPCQNARGLVALDSKITLDNDAKSGKANYLKSFCNNKK